MIGKNWKVQKTPTHRAQMSKKLRKTWDQRTEERKKKDAVKALEKQMKDEKQAEKDVSG
jgi:rRNA-processing protein CGR1